MNEDEIVNSLIQWHREGERLSRELGESDGGVEIFPEAHYNHYGNRGVVDLYTITGGWDGHVYEVKSEFAVKNSTGANEILRQYNRTREFFPEGSSCPMPTSKLNFELCFSPAEYNARHVIDNADIYAEAAKSNISKNSEIDIGNRICFRLPDPDNITPFLMFSNRFDFRELIRRGRFLSYAEGNRDLFDRIRPAFDQLL